MAWLQATPKVDPATVPKGLTAPEYLPRHEQYKRDGIEPQMPPNPAPYLIDRLLEIGLTEAAGMGAGPVSWLQIDAWSRLTGVALAPWEARLLRRLSSDYLSESRRAEDVHAAPPWRAPVTAEQIEAEERRLMAVLG